MPEQVKAVPPGFHALTPHLTVRNAEQALEFYKNAFGAEVLHVAHMPDGKVMHASLRIGDSMLMLNDEFPDYGTLSPLSTGGSAVTIHIYTDNVDAAFNRAVSAGAQVKMPLADQFWGDRYRGCRSVRTQMVTRSSHQRHVARRNATGARSGHGCNENEEVCLVSEQDA
jgi:PhnB protein